MSDVKGAGAPANTKTYYLSDETLKQGMDLLLFAARDVSAQGAQILAGARLGRAHARALHFISRHPGLSVSELLNLLKVTKQSLNRVLGDLLKSTLVERKIGTADRRIRCLQLTEKGKALAGAVWAAQRPLLANAFKAAGQDAANGFRKVLLGVTDREIRERIGS